MPPRTLTLPACSANGGSSSTLPQQRKVTAPIRRELVEIDGSLPLIAACALANLASAGAFAYDKEKARSGVWRTPEKTLLLLAFLGPFGAYGAMRLCRHKTHKLKFYAVPLFCLFQCILVLTILAGYW